MQKSEPLFNAWFETIEGRISSGEAAPLYGKSAWLATASSESGTTSCVWDRVSGKIFRVTISDVLGRNNNYCWINPTETSESEVSDSVKWSKTDSFDDILEKTSAILNNRKFDPDVVMTFDIDDTTTALISSLALSKNVTIDDIMLEAIKAAVERAEASTAPSEISDQT